MAGSSVFFEGRWKSQTFNASGTFTVPEGVDLVHIEMYGGGGSGSSADGSENYAFAGEGSKPYIGQVAVTPAASVTVTIGAGGIAPVGIGESGVDGADSVFGSVRSPGGLGGGYVQGFGAIGAVQGLEDGKGTGRNGLRGLGGSNSAPYFGGDGGYGNGAGANTGSNAGNNSGAGGGSGTYVLGAPGPGNGGSGKCVVHYRSF